MGAGHPRHHESDQIFGGASLEALTRLADTGRYLSPPRRSQSSPPERSHRVPTHPDALAGCEERVVESMQKSDAELCYRFPEKHAPRSRTNSPPPPPPLPLPLPLQMPATPRAARRHITTSGDDKRDWNELGPQCVQLDDAASSSSQSSLEGSPVPWARGQMEITVRPRSPEPREKEADERLFLSKSVSPASMSPQSSRPASPVLNSSRPASPRPLPIQCLAASAQDEGDLLDTSQPASPRSPPPQPYVSQRQGLGWHSQPLQTPPVQTAPTVGLSPPPMLMTPSLPQLPPLQPPMLVPPYGASMEPIFGASHGGARCLPATPSSPQGLGATSSHPGWQSARSSATSLGHALVTEHDSCDSGMISDRWQTPRRLPPPSELLHSNWSAGAWNNQNGPLGPAHQSGVASAQLVDAAGQRMQLPARMMPPANYDPSTPPNWPPVGARDMASITASTPSALASVVPSPHGRVRLQMPQQLPGKGNLELAALSHRVKSVLRKCKSQLERPQDGTPVSEPGDADQFMHQADERLGQIGRDLFELQSNLEDAHENIPEQGYSLASKQTQLLKSALRSPEASQDANAAADISFGGALDASLRSTCTFGVRDTSPDEPGPYIGDTPRSEVKRPSTDQADACCTSTSASSSSSDSPSSETGAHEQRHTPPRRVASAFPAQRPEPARSASKVLTPRQQEPAPSEISHMLGQQWPGKEHSDSRAAQAGARVRHFSTPGEQRSRHACADRAYVGSVASRDVSPFHARIASNCDALETEMARAREERARRASKVQRMIADSKLVSHQSAQSASAQAKCEEASHRRLPRRMVLTQQLPAPPVEGSWAPFAQPSGMRPLG